jgi:hypothetical protein
MLLVKTGRRGPLALLALQDLLVHRVFKVLLDLLALQDLPVTTVLMVWEFYLLMYQLVI